jgi:two-component system LytT family sensor kinase
MKTIEFTSWPERLRWLGKKILLYQAIAVFIALFFTIYFNQNFHNYFPHSLAESLIYTNLTAFMVETLHRRVFRFKPNRYVAISWKLMLRLIAVTYLGMFIGFEISRLMCNLVLAWIQLPFWSKQNLLSQAFNLPVAMLIVLIMAGFEKLKSNLEKRNREYEDLRNLQLRTQLAVLKARLNPHFLFNSLNAILDLVYKDPRQVETMVHSLARIYRRVLNDAEREWSTVGEEIELLESYLQVERIRLGERLRYTVNCPDELRERPLPSLLLQPLVENAVLHGIAPKIGGGTIEVALERKGERLRILVRDDGMGFAGRQPKPGFGLASIQERLRIIYPGTHAFAIGAGAGGGTQVELELP